LNQPFLSSNIIPLYSASSGPASDSRKAAYLPFSSIRPSTRRILRKRKQSFKNNFKILLNPLPPSDAVRKQEKNILEDLFSSVLSQSKKYHPSEDLKFNNLGNFQSLKFPILMKKILPISLKLNFTPNTVGSYGLTLNLLPNCFGRKFKNV